MKIVWINVIVFLIYHYIAVEGLYHVLTLKLKWQTLFWFFFMKYGSILGITCGAHRLWSHKSYKAKLPLKILLGFLQTVAFQNSIYEWARDHRAHHKYSDTNADPHNSTRGFFFCHMGWLMVRKHPDVFTKGKTIDMSDLDADPVVRLQKKYYALLAPICCFVFPSVVSWYFWQENLYLAFATVGMLRYVLVLHYTWLVNSAAHMWGFKPYDRNIKPAENRFVSALTQGEGWHNYHHVFPWDYKAAELDRYYGNMSTGLIELMAWVGWAYDLKSVPREVIERRKERSGTCDEKLYF